MSQVTFTRPDGKTCSGYLVGPPAATRAAGIVVIQHFAIDDAFFPIQQV